MQKHALIGASLGTMIEYYDYAIFALFMTLMMPVIVGHHSAFSALMGGYIIMLISQLLRPVGGVCFGYFGDRFGRKRTLIFAIVGISVSTILIGLIPGYAYIGIGAFVLVILLKSVQLFCFGGEYNGAGVYVVEHATAQSECFWGGMLTAMTLFGALLASLVGIVLTWHGMPAWSWRLAFIGGGIFGLFGIWYRRKMLESPEFLQDKTPSQPLLQLLKTNSRAILVAASIGAFCTVPFTTVVIFVNPYLTEHGYFDPHQMMILQTAVILFAIVALIVAGFLADRFGPKKVMLTGALIIIFLSIPSLLGLDHHHLDWIIAGQLMLILGNELLLGPSNAYMKRSFPVHARYRGVSLGFCSGMALAGGLTPLIENAIYNACHQFVWISAWPIAVGLAVLFALWRHRGHS